MIEMPHKYTVNETLEILKPVGVGRTTLYKLIDRKVIEPKKLLGKVFITRPDVQKLLREYAVPAGWLTWQQAQNRLRIGRTTMHKLIKNKHLHPVKKGGILYFSPGEIALLER